MSKLARALAVAAMVAAINLAGLTAAAQAHTTDHPSSQADATVRRLLARERSSIPDQAPAHPRLLLAEERPTLLNLPKGAPAQAAADATVRRLLAQERYYSSWGSENPAIQQALDQERYYTTWTYGDTSAPAPAKPSRPTGWLIPALAALAAVLALVAGTAVLAARRATRPHRAGQTA
jgi:hypothetical protein